jgi:hypothetical protein
MSQSQQHSCKTVTPGSVAILLTSAHRHLGAFHTRLWQPPSFASLGLNTELKVEATFSASFTLLLVLACSFSRAALHLNDMNTTRMDIE